MRYDVIETPIGPLLVAADEAGLRRISFPEKGRARQPEAGWVRDGAPFRVLARQLAEYFAGKRTDFDLPLSATGTEFQESVWRALQDIPYGETVSYGTIATRVGRPTAVRAVGAANGANPIAIVIPCHRVIGADGSLTGYGGGEARKKWLLALERARRQPELAV